jgi:hypothetical protein
MATMSVQDGATVGNIPTKTRPLPSDHPITPRASPAASRGVSPAVGEGIWRILVQTNLGTELLVLCRATATIESLKGRVSSTTSTAARTLWMPGAST